MHPTTTTTPVVAPRRDQLDLFATNDVAPRFALATTPEIELALAAQRPVFMGVSGGNDSQTLAWRVCEHLDAIGHTGPRMLIHSDLGRVEWRQSLPVCERLATQLGVELIVVRRRAGDMMDRWLSRWAGNVARYAALECVKLILPWSTPSQRFCQSELKGQILASAMRKRFPTGDIVSAVGIRAEESSSRARMPVWKRDERTTRKTGLGHTWNALLGWTRSDVLDYLRMRGVALHEAYTIYQSSRVSCAFCIMGSLNDLRASASCADNAAIYREMVELEIRSTFSFQGNRWLADVAPQLLDAPTLGAVQEAKERAAAREAAEALLPTHLLFTKGWPTQMPSAEEARLIAHVRRSVAAAVRLDIDHTDEASVLGRYAQLLEERAAKAPATGLVTSTPKNGSE